ncbi:hypothetical protein SESBI_29796 [Sesbania bispinosa]|nr:hypothetical protein SESBI_29796 [Sesbania bispinosa]
MSEGENPPPVLPSLQPQTDSAQADAKPFSIRSHHLLYLVLLVFEEPLAHRQYVSAWRQKNISGNWPFPEKYLQMCVERGIKDVLPPFEPQKTSLAEPFIVSSNLMHSQNGNNSKDAEFCKTEEQQNALIKEHHPQNIKNECNLFSHGEGDKDTTNQSQDYFPSSHEEGNQPHYGNVSVNLSQSQSVDTLPSPPIHAHKSSPTLEVYKNKAKKEKRKRGRRKCKKRTMEDILAEAKHCTIEESYRKFCYNETVAESKGSQQMVPLENVPHDHQMGEDSSRKGGSEIHQGANNADMTGKGPLLIKFKLNGCNVNRNNGT